MANKTTDTKGKLRHTWGIKPFDRIKPDGRRKPRKTEKQRMIKEITEGTNYPNVSRLATDPNSRFSWDLPVPFSALPPEDKKSVDDYLGVMFEEKK